MKTLKLGDTSMKVFNYVAGYVAKEGYAPTYREIMDACKLKSTSQVGYHLHRARWMSSRG